MKTLDRKLGALLRGSGARTDFIIADAKDADMGVNGGEIMYRRGGVKMYHGLGGSLSA